MSVRDEIMTMENKLREAELGPDPQFFETVLSDDALLDGQKLKSKVVEAHQPGKMPKFTKVEMSDVQIIEHGANAAVVTCTGYYERAEWLGSLKFMRVWLKRDQRWQIIAGTTQKL